MDTIINKSGRRQTLFTKRATSPIPFCSASLLFTIHCSLLTVLFSFCVLLPSFSQTSPLNPAFLDYLQQPPAAGTLSTGYIPPLKQLYTSPGQYPPVTAVRSLPSVYDLRTLGKMTPVKNQGSCGSCWAFATFGSMESFWKMLGTSDFDLSENNLKNCHGFDYLPCNGGQSWMSISYLTRRSGPVYEASDPYVAANQSCLTGLTPVAYEMNARFLPNNNTLIKQTLMEYGGIFTAFYWNAAYYNASNYTYYYSGANEANHAVVIAGWDDNKVTAGGTGAWLIKNSWGASWGQAGYFYISYNDSRINCEVSYYPTRHAIPSQSIVFMYDQLGEVIDYGLGSSTAFALVKFIASPNNGINRIASWVASGNGSIDMEIYDNFNGSQLSGLLESVPGILTPYAGYYTIDLPVPLYISSGNDFYIKLKYVTPGYNFPIPVESNQPGYSSGAVIQSGVAWVSSDGLTWSAIGNGTANPYDLCIRAYTGSYDFLPTVQAGTDSACPGQSVTLPVKVIYGSSPFTSVKLRMEYDSTLMTLQSLANIHPSLSGAVVTTDTVTATIRKICFSWSSSTPLTLPAQSKLFDLNMTYLSGNPVLSFNNTANYGWDCQYTDAQFFMLYDNPADSFYVSGHVFPLPLPVPTISGISQLCLNTGQFTYTTETGMTSYYWEVSPGGSVISGQGSPEITVDWQQAGDQWVSVTYITPSGCAAASPTVLPVVVNTVPGAAGLIYGTPIVCQGDSAVSYITDSIPEAQVYVWTVPPGAVITEGNLTREIKVLYTLTASPGDLTVCGNNLCGNGTLSPAYPVTVNPLPAVPVIIQQGDSLLSDIGEGNQWYTLSGMIPGATGQVYYPEATGDYYDIVTWNDCSSAPSNVVHFVLIGLPDALSGDIRLFPNPVTDRLNLEFPDHWKGECHVTLTTASGSFLQSWSINDIREVKQACAINCSGLSPGIYFLRISALDQRKIFRLIKLPD